jgi:hypothetical protein
VDAKASLVVLITWSLIEVVLTCAVLQAAAVYAGANNGRRNQHRQVSPTCLEQDSFSAQLCGTGSVLICLQRPHVAHHCVAHSRAMMFTGFLHMQG